MEPYFRWTLDMVAYDTCDAYGVTYHDQNGEPQWAIVSGTGEQYYLGQALANLLQETPFQERLDSSGPNLKPFPD